MLGTFIRTVPSNDKSVSKDSFRGNSWAECDFN